MAAGARPAPEQLRPPSHDAAVALLEPAVYRSPGRGNAQLHYLDAEAITPALAGEMAEIGGSNA